MRSLANFWIGKNKTKNQEKFIILALDFSGLKLDPKEPDKFVHDFEQNIINGIKKCSQRYSLKLENLLTDPSFAFDQLLDISENTAPHLCLY